jgi:alkyl sulfatase BDS1-like metallo-beta-lactamase superfamily hydrolase
MSDLPFEDRADFADADRGLIGSLNPCVLKDASGRVVWDNDAFSFLGGDCPDTANPSLWRQPGQLVEASARGRGPALRRLPGGADAVVAKAGQYAEAGDLRFAAELLNHAVFADPAHHETRQALAAVYDQLGYGAENGTWRNFYLMGALELRHGAVPPSLLAVAGAAVIAQTGISGVQQAISYLVFALIGSIGVGAPVVIYFAMGERSEAMLAGLKDWMGRNNAVIMSILCLVIGAKLIGDAISGLT